MSYKSRREALLDALEDRSLVIVFSGKEAPANEDDYLPFAVNSQFFYLTGLQRPGMALVMLRCGEKREEHLFIEEADETMERWTGKMPRPDEVRESAEIENVFYTTALWDRIGSFMSRCPIENAFFDLFRCGADDMPSCNFLQAEAFRSRYPGVRLRDLHLLMEPLRACKDEEEIEKIRHAASITKKGLDAVLQHLKPGLYEYQIQAVFEGSCMYHGAEQQAFPTIAAGGINACSMHYASNRDRLEDGSLLLLDLGAKYNNYCSDVSRTYPVNGRFSPLQRKLYELVLKANRAVAKQAAPGVTFAELNETANNIIGEGLVEMGYLESAEDVDRYYMHSVSHSIGIDVHDIGINIYAEPLKPGMVISNEPGVYVDEEAIGIRIEDDLLITEDGCEVLTAAIPRDPDEIEAIMAGRSL